MLVALPTASADEATAHADYVSRQLPDGHQEYFGYDNAGRLEWSTEVGVPSAGGTVQTRTIEHDYDELHRPSQVQYPSSPQTIAGFTVTTTYDEFGRVKTVADNTGTSTYTLDVLDRLTQVAPSGGRKTATLSSFIDGPTQAWKMSSDRTGKRGQETPARLYRLRSAFSRLWLAFPSLPVTYGRNSGSLSFFSSG